MWDTQVNQTLWNSYIINWKMTKKSQNTWIMSVLFQTITFIIKENIAMEILEVFWQTYNGCQIKLDVSWALVSRLVTSPFLPSPVTSPAPPPPSLYCCVWDVLNHLSWQVPWLYYYYYPDLWRADSGHCLFCQVICIFIAAVAFSVNTPLTRRADPGPNGSTLLFHLKWECPLVPGSAMAETQAPVDLAFWDGNGVSSHVNVDFPLGKMIDLCCAVAVNRK